MIKKNKKNNTGFVLLFSVVLSSIILAISMGVANIAFKEIRFSTSAKDTNDAFFAADVGAECALFNDRTGESSFVAAGTRMVYCLGHTSSNPISLSGLYPVLNFAVPGLGTAEKGCALVTVDKNDPAAIKLISKGYNICDCSSGACTPGANSVERELELNY